MLWFPVISFGKRIRLVILVSAAVGLVLSGWLSPDNHASAEDDLPSEWRAQIIDALGWSGDMGTIDLLERAAADPDPEIRRAALRASAKLGHPAAARWILPALNDPITSVRLQAIAASVSLGLRSALPDLTAMRSDEELWIRLRVEQAFDRLAPEQNAALPRDGAR